MKRTACSLILAGAAAVAGPALGQSTELVSDAEAADVARFVADRAAEVAVRAPTNRREAKARARIQELAELAHQLEAKIQDGTSREGTREIYRRLRARRLALIGLGLEGDIGVPKEDLVAFEQMMAELGAYYRTAEARKSK